MINTELVLDCLQKTPLSALHKDGWRAEHLLALSNDDGCAVAPTNMVVALTADDGTDATANIMSFVILVIILKKTDAEMQAINDRQGDEYLQPHRPICIGSTSPKLACNRVLSAMAEEMGPAIGPN
jgi:hypothetical protein